MRAVTDRETLARDVARWEATRDALSRRLHLILTALALASDAQAVSQERLDALADDRDDELSADNLQRLGQTYRRMLRELPPNGAVETPSPARGALRPAGVPSNLD